MNAKLALFVASSLVAGAAFAEDPAPAKKAEHPVLNLKLEEGGAAAPRITFGPREPAAEKAPASTLPGLGSDARQSAADRPTEWGKRSDTGSSPFPKDTNPGR